MKNAGISEISLNKEFIFKFDNGGVCSASFSRKTDSASRIIKRITQVLKNKLEQEHKVAALEDIERQIIERHDEIFSFDNNSDHRSTDEYDEYITAFLEKVRKIKQQHTESRFTYEDWQGSVAEKYDKLRRITEKNFPEAWPMLQFCLAVKSILHIDGCSLPFMGVILAIPSSMKTLVIQLFRKYPHSFYSDNFTPNSFESHNASLSEEQLQKIDLLPKLNNKLFLTPELAPIFTANEDELRKSLGIITRILDGHGLESDSGSQGHRKYGDTFFVWIGAAVEVPHRVWRLLGTLGHKMYMLRPTINEKSVKDLELIAKENNFQEKFKEVQDSLLEYLIDIDAAPGGSNNTKIKWNRTNDQEEAIKCIAHAANLLKRLRETVYVTESKTSRYKTNNKSAINDENEDNQEKRNSNFLSLNGSDYDTDYPIVEDPSRAVVLLRNLALGNAIAQGRDFINFDDLPIVANVVLSTTTRARSELMKLLLVNDGELTTSEVVNTNRVSAPFAKKTMRELAAVGIVDITAVANYSNSELKITLKEEYNWFKGQQFKELLKSHKTVARSPKRSDEDKNQTAELSSNNNENYVISGQSENSCDKESQSYDETKATLEGHIKNLEECDSLDTETISECDDAAKRNICTNSKITQSKTLESYDSIEEDPNSTKNHNSCESLESSEKNIIPLRGSELNQHVTVTELFVPDDPETHNLVLKEILGVIKDANGSVISFNSAVKSACKKNERVRAYLGEKLTSRENKKVRNIAVEIIRNDNVEVVKHKPLLLVKWIQSTKLQCNSESFS